MCQVSGVRFQVSGVRCRVSGVRCQGVRRRLVLGNGGRRRTCRTRQTCPTRLTCWRRANGGDQRRTARANFAHRRSFWLIGGRFSFQAVWQEFAMSGVRDGLGALESSYRDFSVALSASRAWRTRVVSAGVAFLTDSFDPTFISWSAAKAISKSGIAAVPPSC